MTPTRGQILFNVPAVELSYSRRLDHIFPGGWRFLDALEPLCISSRVLHFSSCIHVYNFKLRRATSCRIRSHSQSGAVMPFVQACFTAIQNAKRAISKINPLVFVFILFLAFIFSMQPFAFRAENLGTTNKSPSCTRCFGCLEVLSLHAFGHKGTVSASGRWRAGATWIAFRCLLTFTDGLEVACSGPGCCGTVCGNESSATDSTTDDDTATQ